MAYIELLELDDSAGAHSIAERLRERHKYFSTLADTAPTTQLKAIYQKKLTDLAHLAVQYAVELGAAGIGGATTLPKEYAAPNTLSSVNLQAMLVLHTEGRALRSFPLVPGVNILGRTQNVIGNSVLIDDDYMSRSHAVVEIVSVKNQTALLYDAGELPGFKPSTNGVFLNGDPERLSGKVPIRPEDTLQVGYAKLVLTYASGDRQSEAVASVGSRIHSRTVFIKVN